MDYLDKEIFREYSSGVNRTLTNVHTVHDFRFQFTIFYSSQLLNSIEKMKSSAGRIPQCCYHSSLNAQKIPHPQSHISYFVSMCTFSSK